MKYIALTLALVGLAGCSSGGDSTTDASSATNASSENGLTSFQMEHGIGPVTQTVDYDDLDQAMADRGKAIFDSKCMSCHKFGERYVGPDLAQVTETRTGAYIMNMILNPAEMVQKHPEARAKLAEFMTPMPFQNVTEDEARDILEYLRSQNNNQ
jgi:cytochrome c1